MKTNKTNRLTIRLTSEQMEKLKSMAEYEELNVSAYLRQLIDKQIGGNSNGK